MTNTNELVSLAPALVSEAILRTNENKERFDLIEKKHEGEIVFELINQLPQCDDNREEWIDSLALAVIGYRKKLPSYCSTSIMGQNNEISENLQLQLEDDFLRWGDTWKKRPIEGQLERTKARYKDYIDQYQNGDQPFPWLKVLGGEIINLVRIDLRDIENYKKSLTEKRGFETK